MWGAAPPAAAAAARAPGPRPAAPAIFPAARAATIRVLLLWALFEALAATAGSRAGARVRVRGGGGGGAPRPEWPVPVCLGNAAGDVNIYHFFIFNVAALVAHEARAGYAVRVHALFNASLAFHAEAFALLLAPDFFFDARAPRGDVALRCEHADWMSNGELADTLAGVPLTFGATPQPVRECAKADAELPAGAGCVLSPPFKTFGWGDRTDPAAHVALRALLLGKLAAAGALPAPGAPLDGSALYYILRQKSFRNVLNEDAFRPGLEALGFRFVRLETLTVFEKARLFATARAVISPQSAGLAFLAALDVRALALEIFTNDGPDKMLQFVHLAEDLGLPLLRYADVDVVETEDTRQGVYGHVDVAVRDPAAFVAFVAAQLAATDARARAPRPSESPALTPSASPTPWLRRG
jgi:hypothetical protein